MVIGKEVGTECGTSHIHVYVEFENARSFASVTKITPRAHVEVCKGSSMENRAYVVKDSDFQERGDRSLTEKEKGESEKRRWETAFEAAKAGRIEDIDADIVMRHYGNIKRIQKDFMSKAIDLPDYRSLWIVGTTGSGKTTLARKSYPDYYTKLPNKWWDGYSNPATVILEDLDPYKMKMEQLVYELKMWGDKFSFTGETKGGMVSLRPKTFIVTSQYTIDELFRDFDSCTRDAISRRFREVLYDKSQWENPPDLENLLNS